MAFDPFLEEKPRVKPAGHELGQDLSTLSVSELDERIGRVTLKHALTSYSEVAEADDYDWPLSAFVPEVLKHFDQQDYVELSLTAAFYAMVGRMLDAMGVQLEPDAREYSPKLPA